MGEDDERLEELESEIEDVKSNLDEKSYEFEQGIDKLNFELENLQFSREKYEIYLYPYTIKSYIENLLKLQKRDKTSFFPSNLVNIKKYFNEIFEEFDYNFIKYKNLKDFDVIAKIIAFQGRSGTSFIESVENIIELNKPLMLYYGIMQLATYFSNLHFNFTWKNNELSSIRKNMQRHGVDSFEFKNKVSLENPVNNILKKKIRLERKGLAHRFFLTYEPSFLHYFIIRQEISLIDLLKLFFLHSPIPNTIRNKFKENFGNLSSLPNSLKSLGTRGHRNEKTIFTIYLLSFLFCHLCRYKLYEWTLLLESDEMNIGYFVRFFLKFAKTYFIKTIFDLLHENDRRIKHWLKHPVSNLLLI